MPYLRNKVHQEMKPFYQNLLANYGLDKHTYPTHLKTILTTTLRLNYESMNNNAALGRDTHFDYCVKDEVSLDKLFMKAFMANFNAFDSCFDASAALAVPCCTPPFSSAVLSAELVRFEVENEWAHCDYASWMEVKYNTCFDRMETLVEDLGFALAEKQSSWLSCSCGGSMARCHYTYLKNIALSSPLAEGVLPKLYPKADRIRRLLRYELQFQLRYSLLNQIEDINSQKIDKSAFSVSHVLPP